MNKDQVVDRVGVIQPTCAIIHDECVWESKEELVVKDKSLLATPHPLHPDIPCDSSTIDFPCENSFLGASTSNHSQDTLDVSLSLQCREDTSSSEHSSILSSIFLENTEGEHLCFSSTPLPDSTNHDNVNEHLEFFDLGCHDLFTSSSDQNVDSTVVNLSKTLVCDDLSVHEVEIPQIVEALQPELMVMSGPYCLEVGFASSQEIVETLKDPHHSLFCIEDQPNTQISLPPLELHDPIDHPLEESFTASTHLHHKWYTFLTSCHNQENSHIQHLHAV